MLARVLTLLALLAVLALPFVLRPSASAGKTDDVVVIVTPHNEAIRQEFARGFAAWYRAHTGRTVRVDWRVLGGTTEISRYLEGAYTAAFESEWTHHLHRPWSSAIEARFQAPQSANENAPEVRAAREAFLASKVSCGIDLFFGGDAYQFGQEAAAGRLVASGVQQRNPEWFTDAVIPAEFGGERFRDSQGRWIGAVLSSYGILFNRDSYRRLGITREPAQWPDLTDPRLMGQVALADPTKSGSVCEAFEAMIQQQMQRRLAELRTQRRVGVSPPSAALSGPAESRDQPAAGAATENAVVRDGWLAGLRLIQEIGANARYFTDNSQKPPIDVAAGDCAAGLCIDFYGRQQQEAVRRRGDLHRLGYVTPVGGSAASTDPIGLLRGAPHPAVAAAFIEYTLSLDGQKLWSFKPGAPGGPTTYALRRMPVRRDFYAHPEWKPLRSDPEDDPYDQRERFVYHEQWTGNLFREIGFVTRVMCLDTHRELVSAWRAINAAAEPRRSHALAVMQTLDAVSYDRTAGEIHARLNAKDRVEEVKLATELGAYFRANYARAEAIARGTGS